MRAKAMSEEAQRRFEQQLGEPRSACQDSKPLNNQRESTSESFKITPSVSAQQLFAGGEQPHLSVLRSKLFSQNGWKPLISPQSARQAIVTRSANGRCCMAQKWRESSVSGLPRLVWGAIEPQLGVGPHCLWALPRHCPKVCAKRTVT